MTTLLVFAFILSLLVFVHELGHFVTAKKAGITVEEFAIGFPPRAIKLWQEIGKITLNGRQMLLGRKTNIPRALQVGSIVEIATKSRPDGQVEITHITLLGHEDEQSEEGDSALDTNKLKVEALEKPTQYSLNWIPFGGYVKMLGEEDPTAGGSFASKSKTARLIVLFAGAAMNLITAVIVFTLMFATGTPEPEFEDVAYISGIAQNSPAEAAGLQPGDIVIKGNNQNIANTDELISFIKSNLGQEVTFVVQNETGEQTVVLTPRVDPPLGEGAVGIQIGPKLIGQTIAQYSPLEAFLLGSQTTVAIVVQTFTLPVAIARDIIPADQARPIGPVGIYNLTGSAVEASLDVGVWYPLLFLTAVLSIALAVTNLLPLPALDGGRILFIIVEAIRGKRLSPEKEGAIHFVGLAILLALMFVVSFYDINSPIEPPRWTDLFQP